jgi:hypothetical protein
MSRPSEQIICPIYPGSHSYPGQHDTYVTGMGIHLPAHALPALLPAWLSPEHRGSRPILTQRAVLLPSLRSVPVSHDQTLSTFTSRRRRADESGSQLYSPSGPQTAVTELEANAVWWPKLSSRLKSRRWHAGHWTDQGASVPITGSTLSPRGKIDDRA